MLAYVRRSTHFNFKIKDFTVHFQAYNYPFKDKVYEIIIWCIQFSDLKILLMHLYCIRIYTSEIRENAHRAYDYTCIIFIYGICIEYNVYVRNNEWHALNRKPALHNND